MTREWWLYCSSLIFILFHLIYARTTKDPYGIKLPVINFLPFKKYGFILNFTDTSQKVISACCYLQIEKFGKNKDEVVDSSLRVDFSKLPNVVPPLWFYRDITYELKTGEYISGMTEFNIKVNHKLIKTYTKPFCVMMKSVFGNNLPYDIYS